MGESFNSICWIEGFDGKNMNMPVERKRGWNRSSNYLQLVVTVTFA